MRRLRRASRRQGGEVLHHARGHGRRPRGQDHRGPGRRRRAAASDAGSLPRASRPAVRLLHPRHDHDRGRSGPPQGPRPLRPRHSRRARRQSVPLHRLPEHRCVDRRRRQGDGANPISLNRFHRDRDQEVLNVRIQISSSGDRAAGRQSAGEERRRQGDRRRPHAGAGHEAAARQPAASGRPLPYRRARRHRDEGPFAGDRRDRQARRRREFADRRRSHPGAGRTRRPDRRSRGAPQGHHRRLARQQRSDRGLSRRRVWRSAPPSSPTSAASRRRNSSRACSRPRSRATRSSPR